MSVILPRYYKEIADELGEAYAKVRDSIFKDGGGDSAYADVQIISTSQDQTPDDTTRGSGEPDESGGADTPESDDPNNANYSVWLESGKVVAGDSSIANDMGGKLFTLANTTVASANSKKVAANIFAAYLRGLNTHVTNRIYAITNGDINAYYSTYSFNASDGDLSLFDSVPGGALDLPVSYFTAEFVELSATLGIAIDAEYQTP